MHSLRIPGAAAATALVAIGVGAGGAQAATENVVPTIKHESRVLKRAAASENLKNFKLRTVAQAKRDEPKIRALATTLDRAATVVSQSSTSSAAQRRGKADWVRGVRGVARGYRQLDDALADLVRHDKSAAQGEALKAEKTMLGASKTLIKADKLLKIQSS